MLEADHNDLEWRPDPRGRAHLDRWVRKTVPVFDPMFEDPAVERMREAWARNTLLDEGGDALFEIRAEVGDKGPNGRVDVAKVEALLEASGALDLKALKGPTGLFATGKGAAIRAFQRANGLGEDGQVWRNGPTIRALKAALQPKMRARQAAAAQPPRPNVPNRSSNAPPSPTPIIPVPAYRKQARGIDTKNWNAWSQLIGRLPRLQSTEKRAYMEIFAAEGGNSVNPKNGATSGIKDDTLDQLIHKKWVKGIKRGTKAKDLSLNQRAGIYRDYFDFAMNEVGGSSAFGRIDDAAAASAVADTLFRHGRTGGGQLIREAINKLAPGTLAMRGATGKKLPFNETALKAFQTAIADPVTRRKFLDALADLRIKDSPGEALRFNHFRFQKSP